jgi:hypothetical protein
MSKAKRFLIPEFAFKILRLQSRNFLKFSLAMEKILADFVNFVNEIGLTAFLGVRVP